MSSINRARRPSPRKLAAGALTILLGAVITACSATATGGGGQARASSSILTVSVNPCGPQQRNFNPLNASSPVNVCTGLWAMINEPLIQYDSMNPGVIYPWLATHWAWSNGGKTMTFTLRKDVKWSDGKPFTSADVVFTFDLIKKFPALNLNGITFASAVASGPYTVQVNFTSPGYTQLWFIGQLPILPQHIWSTVKNPATYTDANPVGTGPYVLSSWTASTVILKKNPLYWQPVPVAELEYPNISSATTLTSDQITGTVAWQNGPNGPGYQKIFIAKNPAYNHVWTPSLSPGFLVPNDTVYPMDMVAFRKALSEAINRPLIAKDGEGGLVTPMTSATGLVTNEYKFLDPAYANDKLTYDPAGAKAILKAAGFHWNSSGQLTGKGNQPITLTIEAPSGFWNYMGDIGVIAQNLDAIGINTTVRGLSVNTWAADIGDGHFQLTQYWSTGGPSPYYWMNGALNDQLLGNGTNASGDQERWKGSTTQTCLANYVATASQSALNCLEGIMVNDMPLIPETGNETWGTYTSSNFVGWPTPSNPYADASPVSPNGEYVVLHLKPRT